MGVNLDKPLTWRADIAKSVDMYNDWFMTFAPQAFRATRIDATAAVEATLKVSDGMRDISPALIRANPSVLPTFRMSTCPPIAVDRLIGLAGVSKTLVYSIEKYQRLPKTLSATADVALAKIGAIIERLADPDIFVWIGKGTDPTEQELHRAATIVADRLCGAVTNPIIRNAQEKRQLAAIKTWLEARGYKGLVTRDAVKFDAMPPGTFSMRTNVPVKLAGGKKTVNIPIDVVVKPKAAKTRDLPIFWEAKSAGDYTNTNKRRKEEAVKMTQLRSTYGKSVRFNLFLCGYFDGGYLGYEATEGIDWVWEHRIDDFRKFGI